MFQGRKSLSLLKNLLEGGISSGLDAVAEPETLKVLAGQPQTNEELFKSQEAREAITASTTSKSTLYTAGKFLDLVEQDPILAQQLLAQHPEMEAILVEGLASGSPNRATGRGLVAGGSQSGTATKIVEFYLLVLPFVKSGMSMAALSLSEMHVGSASNRTSMLTLGGAPSTTGGDHFLFATPATKGVSPATLNAFKRSISCGSNDTQLFAAGGYRDSGATLYADVEQYLFATPASKGTAPANLSTAGMAAAAGSSPTQLFLIGGGSAATTSTEQYLFSTPGTKGTAPIAPAVARVYATGASNGSILLVIGGQISGGAYTNTNEQYSFTVPGTLGSVPVNLSALRGISASLANAEQALILGGYDGTNYLSSGEQYLFSNLATKGAAPAAISSTRYGLAGASDSHGGLV